VLALPEPPRTLLGPATAAARPPGRFDDEVRSLLTRALAAAGGRIYGPQGAAALLGLKPTTLQGKLRKHGIGDYPRRGLTAPRAPRRS
jgi:formate hydrogenlyase transcriptional activator